MKGKLAGEATSGGKTWQKPQKGAADVLLRGVASRGRSVHPIIRSQQRLLYSLFYRTLISIKFFHCVGDVDFEFRCLSKVVRIYIRIWGISVQTMNSGIPQLNFFWLAPLPLGPKTWNLKITEKICTDATLRFAILHTCFLSNYATVLLCLYRFTKIVRRLRYL